MRSRLPLNAMRAFEAAARHLSFASAADELGVTPTAVSHQIRQLEEIIGTPLFKRRPRPIALTQTGAQLLPDLRLGFDMIERSFNSLSPKDSQRVLKVTSTVAFASGVLLPSLSDWAENNKDLELEIHGSDQPVNLHSDDIDVAIRYAEVPCETLIWDPLCTDRYLPMLAPADCNADQLSPADILQLPLISYRWKNPHLAEPTWEKWWSHASKVDGVLPNLSQSKSILISEESNALEAAVAGNGVVLASEIITRSARALGRLQTVSNIGLHGLNYWLVYPVGARMDDRVLRFHTWLSKILQANTVETLDEKNSSNT